jgi:hypothetical protein
MTDLVKPIEILRDYLAYNFAEDVQVMNFMAVMRNYKAKLLNESLYVDLIALEAYINSLKSFANFDPYIRYECRSMTKPQINKLIKFVGKTNPLNIAEITYNTDKCFCLNLKFYRPIPCDQTKKTTVKLLKKGKINFDGGNSELEMLELYHWLEHIYSTHPEMLVDVSKIKNVYDSKLVESLQQTLIYSDGESDDDCATTGKSAMGCNVVNDTIDSSINVKNDGYTTDIDVPPVDVNVQDGIATPVQDDIDVSAPPVDSGVKVSDTQPAELADIPVLPHISDTRSTQLLRRAKQMEATTPLNPKSKPSRSKPSRSKPSKK